MQTISPAPRSIQRLPGQCDRLSWHTHSHERWRTRKAQHAKTRRTDGHAPDRTSVRAVSCSTTATLASHLKLRRTEESLGLKTRRMSSRLYAEHIVLVYRLAQLSLGNSRSYFMPRKASKGQQKIASLDFVVNRCFMKLFKTTDMQVVKICREHFDFVLPICNWIVDGEALSALHLLLT